MTSFRSTYFKPQARRLVVASLSACLSTLPAQQTPAVDSSLSVVISDPSGATVPGATVRLLQAAAADGSTVKQAATDAAGRAALNLPPGSYTLQIQAAGFLDQEQAVRIDSSFHLQLAVHLTVAGNKEVVNVSGQDVATDPGSNGDALSFKGDRLRTLSENPQILQQQLNALVQTDDGSPAQFRIDGFSGGRFPAKSSIREVRINQNAFSAQFDQRGNTVIDIFTKPGTDQLHGALFVSGNADALNARNPYVTTQPGYHSILYDATLTGPLGKQTSFFLSANRNELQNAAAVNAVILDGSFTPVPLSQAVPNPAISQAYSLRVDRQLGANNSFTGRLLYGNDHQSNSGVGQLVLATQGYTSDVKTTTLQVGNTTILGAHGVAETRFQYLRTRTSQVPLSNAPTLTVQGSFNGGGSTAQLYRDAQDNYEFQEYLSLDHGNHFLRAGARYRLLRDSNFSQSNFNGQYIFPTLRSYQLTVQGTAGGQTPAQIRAASGGASQFSISAGTPAIGILTGDLGVYAEDEWKIRPHFSLISGLRYESQSGTPDHNDPAPRVGFAWGVYRKKHKTPLLTLRGGAGLFYTRFTAGDILNARRQNGVLQRAYYLGNPDFYPDAPPASSLSSIAPTTYRIAPNFHSAYVIGESISASRALGSNASLSLSFSAERGIHQYLSRNVNAPINGQRPLGGTQNVYQYSSEGISNTRTLSTNYNAQFGSRGGAWASYQMRWRQSDVAGPEVFPSNSYNIGADYGRTASLARERLYVGGWTDLPYGISGSMFMSAHSATRFNVTTGTDLNGDSIYNDRPAFATDLTRPSVVRTSIGNFDTQPVAGQSIIPMNYGHAPGFFSLQFQLGRMFAFGPAVPLPPEAAPPAPGAKAAKPDRRFHLFFAAEAQNVLNHVNPATPVGQLSSPYFGRSITLNSDQTGSTAANRLINLYTVLRF